MRKQPVYLSSPTFSAPLFPRELVRIEKSLASITRFDNSPASTSRPLKHLGLSDGLFPLTIRPLRHLFSSTTRPHPITSPTKLTLRSTSSTPITPDLKQVAPLKKLVLFDASPP